MGARRFSDRSASLLRPSFGGAASRLRQGLGPTIRSGSQRSRSPRAEPPSRVAMNAVAETLVDAAEALPGVKRFIDADARQALEQIKSSPMMAEGKVCLMGLDAIRDRFGPRWLGRRERVFEHVQASLRKQVGPHGFFLRVSETDFVVAQPNVSRLAGQAYCLNCLRDVVTFFLGEALVRDIVVHEVLAIEGGVIGARKLDTTELQA